MEMQPDPGISKHRPGSRAALTSFALALGVSAGLLFAPTGEVSSCFGQVTGASVGGAPAAVDPCQPSVSHPSLLDVEGPHVVVPLSLPIAFAVLGLGFGRTRFRRAAAITAGCLLFGFVVVGGFSIGPYYLPSAVAMFVAGKPENRVPVPA